MNETAEIIEYLRIVERKLQSLMQDIRNIRNRLRVDPDHQQTAPTFFSALSAEDALIPERTKHEQCPHN